MSEQVGNEKKIDVAKKVMHEIVPQLPVDAAVGLTVYGHRRQGDCSDIETVFVAGQSDRRAILQQVDRMKPVGKTPLARSLLQVSSGIKLKDAETTIVLVSDGIDTCGGDPCSVVKELKKSGLKFVLHTVGFDVDPKASQQLQCMAQAGGGEYFVASDAKTLLDALKTVTVEVAGKVEHAKTELVKVESGLGKLRLAMPKNSEKSLKHLQIIRKNDGKVLKDITRVESDSTHPLLRGVYTIRIGFAQPNYGDPTWAELGDVTIAKGQTREVILGSISFSLPEEVEKRPRDTGLNIKTVEVVHAGTDRAVAVVYDNKNGFYNFKPKPVVPGLYDVRFEYVSAEPFKCMIAKNISVQAGQDTLVALNTGIRLTGNIGEITGWDLIPIGQELTDVDEDGSLPKAENPLLVVRNKLGIGGNRRFVGYTYLVPPGHYKIDAFLDGMSEPLPVAENIDLSSGTIMEFDAGL